MAEAVADGVGRKDDGGLSSQWRSPIAIFGRQDHTKILEVASLDKSRRIKRASAASIHDEFNHIAIGTRGDPSGGTISVLNLSDLQSVRNVTLPGPVYDLSWRGNVCLAASTDGRLFHLDLTSTNPKAKELVHPIQQDTKRNFELLNEMRLLHAAGITRRVSLHPLPSVKRFVSLVTTHFHIWDLEKQQPIVSRSGARSMNAALEWSPHAQDIFALGGHNKAVKIFDTRAPNTESSGLTASASARSSNWSCIWKKRHTHEESVNDIRWHPFIPYWVASAGFDAVIRIWDLRFGASPMLQFTDHTNSANAIAWSPLHTEILVSGASDRMAKVWSMTVPPHHIIDTMARDTFMHKIISVGFSTAERDKACFVSEGGEVSTLNLTRKFLSQVMVSNNATNVDEKKVAQFIYFRDMDAAFKTALQVAERYKAEKRLAELDSILRMCAPMELTSNATWSTELTNEAGEFEREVQHFSTSIPPNFSDSLTTRVSSSTARKLEILKLNSRLAVLVNEQDARRILDLTTAIGVEMDLDLDSIDRGLLASAFKVVKQREPSRCVAWGLELEQKFERSTRLVEFFPLGEALLSPTVFDQEDGTTGTRGHDELIPYLTKASVAQQLNVLRKYIELQPSQSQSAEEAAEATKARDEKVLSLLEGHTNSLMSISAEVNRGYLDALLRQQRFDLFYVLATQLVYKTRGFPFEAQIRTFMREQGFSAFNKFVSDCRSKKAKLPSKRTCVLQILFIERNVTTITDLEYLLKYLPSALRKMTKAITKMLSKKAKSKNESTKRRANEHVKALLDDINTLLLESDPKSVKLAEELGNLKVVLQRFLLGKEL